MLMNGDLNCVYDICNGVDWLSAFGDYVRRCMHCGGRGAILPGDEATFVDILFRLCTEGKAYASRLAVIVQIGLELIDAVPITQGLDCVTFLRNFIHSIP